MRLAGFQVNRFHSWQIVLKALIEIQLVKGLSNLHLVTLPFKPPGKDYTLKRNYFISRIIPSKFISLIIHYLARLDRSAHVVSIGEDNS